MKFTKKYFIGLIFCVVLAASPIGSELFSDDTEINIINAAMPALAGMSTMLITTPPAGPILFASLSLIHVASMIITGSSGDDQEADKALTSLDLLKVQTHLSEEIQNVGKSVIDNIKQAVRDLTHVIEASGFTEQFRNTLEKLRRGFIDKIKIVLDSKITGKLKNTTMDSLLDYDSSIRETVRSFITTFIKPPPGVAAAGPVKLFYEFVLEKHHLLAMEDEDFDSESLHAKLFKSYLYVLKTLSDINVLVISAHVIQFQQEIKQGRLSDAASTKEITKGLIRDYKNDMKDLMDKTKWALDKASREIRNSAVYTKKKGETVQSLSFAQILPRIMYMGDGGCQEDKGAVNIKDYDTGNCDSFPGVMPANSELSIYENPTADPERPYQFMTIKSPGEEEQTFGHNSTDPNLIVQQVSTHDQCYTVFCTAYKKNAAAISTQRVRAEPGYVITGMRFRVDNNIVYIDIQEGKFKDPLTVDPDSVRWKKTPESTQVQYLSSSISKLELGDFELKDNSYLTVIQLKLTNQRDGIVRVFIDGSTAPNNWNTFGPHGSSEKISDLTELNVSGGDDPEIDDSKCKISNRGVQSYYIRFGTSGIKEDFGRTSLPLIDVREVVSDPPAPLNGFGIFYCGGVMSLNLVTADLSPLVDYKPIEQFTEPIMKV